MSISASAKYAIIREMTMRDNNRLNLSWLCETAGVSRSGYYSYLESEDLRPGIQQRCPRHLYAADSSEAAGRHEPEENPAAHE